MKKKRKLKIISQLLLLVIMVNLFQLEVRAANYTWPVPLSVRNYITTGFYGYTNHNGADFAVPLKTPVYAVADGTVTTVIDRGCLGSHRSDGSPKCSRESSCDAWKNNGNNGSYGNYVYITHGNGVVTRYCHLSTGMVVQQGQSVKQGQLIGYSGTSGNSTGPHLHLEFRVNGVAKNPADYLTKENVASVPPTNPRISANQVWYDLKDTIEITAYADGATSYYMSMFKDGERIKGETVSGGKFTMAASDYGIGDYSVYFSCTNSTDISVETEWLTFSVVGAAGYSSVWTSAPIYDLDDTVFISVSPICSDGQWLGIDKNGVDRVITQQTETTYTIAASQLGVGSYSAYFTVYNGSGGIDTERVEFVIAEPCNLGEQFYARIKNTGRGMYVSNISGNVEGESLDCDRSRTWRFDRQSDGTYKIISSLDNGAMDVTDYGNAGNGTNIQMNTSWDTTAQKFYIYEAYGAYYIKPICCDLFLDMDQNAPHNLAAWGGGADWPAQKFEIIKVNSDDVGVHKYVPEVTKEATCTEEGTRTYTCSVCQDSYTETIEMTSHQYSDEWTIDVEATFTSEGSKSHHCLNCDARTDITVIPKLEQVVEGGIFSLTNASGTVGQTVDVYINMTENPGIVGATLAVEYDTNKLQLISCEDLGVLNDYQFSALDRNPFLLNWEDPLADENNMANGNIAKLQFKILKDLGEEGAELQLSVDTAYDVNVEDVEFSTINGKISMKSYTSGDVNGDGTINSKDSLLVRKYILGENVTINLNAADVNHDGVLNSKDSIILRKYILGDNVELR